MLWAMERRLRKSNGAVAGQIRGLRKELEREFGLAAAAAARLFGPVLWWTSLREEKRLAAGRAYEPRTVIERRNWTAAPSGLGRPAAVPAGAFLEGPSHSQQGVFREGASHQLNGHRQTVGETAGQHQAR